MIRILWTQKQDSGPEARTEQCMAYDSGRGCTVLFGGVNRGGIIVGDTWEWDGESWTQVADSGPPARADSAMAYDAQRSQTVLFSGSNGTADTWGWDGRNWTQLADGGPPARDAHAMAYDSKRQRTVLFGGQSAGVGGRDTGERDLGVGWHRMDSTGGDGASSTHNSHHGLR